MRVVIDTSSLVALVRYYLPFDNDDSLKKFIEKKVKIGEIIILDKVYSESGYYAGGIVVKALDFIDTKTMITKTDKLYPNKKFYNMLENQFCVQLQKSKLNEAEFEIQKDRYLDSPDAKLILYCLPDNDLLELEKPLLVTEETKSENDGKLFKKLPSICSLLNIDCCNLPELFTNQFNMSLSKYLK